MKGEPHDAEAERAVMGAVLLQNEALDEIAAVVQPADFYRVTHRAIYAAMVDIHAKKEPIDMLSLSNVLRARGELDDCGGLVFLATLDALVPSMNAGLRFARRVKDMATRRALIAASIASIEDAQDDALELDDVLNNAERKVLSVRDGRGSAVELVPIRAALIKEYREIERLYERQEDVTGLPTGLADFDRITTGLQPGDLIILGGRPSMGKTAAGMGMAVHAAVKTGRPVVVFEQEMTEGSLIRRMFSSEGSIDGSRLRNGKLLQTDWSKMANAAEKLAHTNLIVDESAGVTMSEIRSRTRRVRQRYGEIALIVVDYLGLLRPADPKMQREQQVATFARELKQLARELRCPVMALSQLNRGLESRADKRPMMSDLRESGAVEQDADLIVFAYRDEVYNPNTKDKGIAELIVAKQRNGPTGTVRVAFQKPFVRFEDLKDGSVQDWG